MKSLFRKMIPLALACAFVGTGLARAANNDAKPDSVWQAYSVTVAPNNDMAFRAGMKSWISCQQEHASKQGFSGWEAQTGSSDYVFATPRGPWSDMDVMDPGGKACGKTFTTDVMPHIKKMSSIVLVDVPDISYPAASHTADSVPKYVEVREYWLRPGHLTDFMDVAKKLTAASVKTKGDRHWRAARIEFGDKDAADIYTFRNADTWAEIGAPAKTNTGAMMDSVYGKKESKALRTKIMGSIKNQAWNVYRYSATLSFVPGKK